MRRQDRAGYRAVLAGCALLGLTTTAHSGLYSNADVRSKTVKICFVGNALTARPDRVQQILTYIKQYEYAANVRFSSLGTCPAATKQTNGNDFYDGDIRVVIPNTSVDAEVPVPGIGCPPGGANSGWGSWSHAPNGLTPNRSCLYNLKLGDDPWNATPYLNHTLHEVGHALGLSHEHVRYDVEKTWVLHYFKTAKDIDQTKAENIYAAGYRNLDEIAEADVAQLQNIAGFGAATDARKLKMDATFLTQIAGVTVAIAESIYATGYSPGHERPFPTAGAVANVLDADLTALQAIPGYSVFADAKKLRDDARAVPPRAVYGGGATYGYLTAYDRASVMHYQFIDPGINGNFDYTGLSDLDRLSVHILYPEDILVAEFVGTTVVMTTGNLVLGSAWKQRGAFLNFVAHDFYWKLLSAVVGTGADLNVHLAAGKYTLQYAYQDFLGRSYSYTGTVHVLEPEAFARVISGPLAARAVLY